MVLPLILLWMITMIVAVPVSVGVLVELLVEVSVVILLVVPVVVSRVALMEVPWIIMRMSLWVIVRTFPWVIMRMFPWIIMRMLPWVIMRMFPWVIMRMLPWVIMRMLPWVFMRMCVWVITRRLPCVIMRRLHGEIAWVWDMRELPLVVLWREPVERGGIVIWHFAGAIWEVILAAICKPIWNEIMRTIHWGVTGRSAGLEAGIVVVVVGVIARVSKAVPLMIRGAEAVCRFRILPRSITVPYCATGAV
jgi:hypothetical protein